MAHEDPITSLLETWVYDVEQILSNALDGLKDDLSSDDEYTADLAAKKATEILDWLYPPAQPLSPQERLRRATEAITSASLSDSEQIAAFQRILRSTGRRRGRPRTAT